MTDRERLIEIIVTAENEVFRAFPYTNSAKRIEMVADYLLENGVIVPPVKEGDTVFYIGKIQCECCKYYIEWDCTSIKCPKQVYSKSFRNQMIKKVGKTVFLTREEAENALKEREQK